MSVGGARAPERPSNKSSVGRRWGRASTFDRGIDPISRRSWKRAGSKRFRGSSNPDGMGKQGAPAKGQIRVERQRRRRERERASERGKWGEGREREREDGSVSWSLEHGQTYYAARLSDNVFLIAGHGYTFPAPESRRKSRGGYYTSFLRMKYSFELRCFLRTSAARIDFPC